MSNTNDSATLRNTTDLEIEDYLKASYPEGTDSHGARAPTVDEVKETIKNLDLAAGLLAPHYELGHLWAKHFEVADEALGCFIRAMSHGDAYYVALDLRKTQGTRYSAWLEAPIPKQEAVAA